jgi:hypothetical protein
MMKIEIGHLRISQGSIVRQRPFSLLFDPVRIIQSAIDEMYLTSRFKIGQAKMNDLLQVGEIFYR